MATAGAVALSLPFLFLLGVTATPTISWWEPLAFAVAFFAAESLTVTIEVRSQAFLCSMSEVVLLGQTVNSYNDGTHDFADLLRRVGSVPGVTQTFGGTFSDTTPPPSGTDPKCVKRSLPWIGKEKTVKVLS